MSVLRVILDGEPLPTAEAIAFWKRFSTWMDEHPGDLAGFAKGEGLASVHPEMHDGGPVLVASRTAPQRPYGVAAKKKASRPVGTGGVGGGGGAKSSAKKKHRP
jgi:hypothetical protein